jgi:very-short-patch-repair endonuclease
MPPLARNARSFTRARRLRREMTEPERLLWMLLRDRRFSGWKIRRQVPLGDYVVDFACFEAKLVIELDGEHHRDPEQAAFDAARTRALEAAGFRVLRLWNGWLYAERDAALETIWQALNGRR